MTHVVADISMSLDGFVTAPGADRDHGLGVGGEVLHRWATTSTDPVDADVLREATEATGAVLMGRRLFDFVDGPNGWSDAMGYGATLAATPPFFVVTHAAPAQVRLRLDFTFVTHGLPLAIEQARVAADNRDVVIMGGAEVVRQAVNAGLVDELRIHLAPVVLGGGTALVSESRRHEMVPLSVTSSTTATHLRYALTAQAPET